VERKSGKSGRGFRRAKRDLRPYNMRISRDHGGGLWTIESDEGQLYLAVLSKRDSLGKSEREAGRIPLGWTA